MGSDGAADGALPSGPNAHLTEIWHQVRVGATAWALHIGNDWNMFVGVALQERLTMLNSALGLFASVIFFLAALFVLRCCIISASAKGSEHVGKAPLQASVVESGITAVGSPFSCHAAAPTPQAVRVSTGAATPLHATKDAHSPDMVSTGPPIQHFPS